MIHPKHVAPFVVAIALALLPRASGAAASFMPSVSIIYDDVVSSATLILFDHEGYTYSSTNGTALYENPRMTVVIAAHARLKREAEAVVITAEKATVYGAISDERALAAGSSSQKSTVSKYEHRIGADELIQVNGQVIKAAAAAKLFPDIPPPRE